MEINDESQETYKVSNQTKFKTSMVRSNLRDFSDVYIYVKETLEVTNTGADLVQNNRKN